MTKGEYDNGTPKRRKCWDEPVGRPQIQTEDRVSSIDTCRNCNYHLHHNSPANVKDKDCAQSPQPQ